MVVGRRELLEQLQARLLSTMDSVCGEAAARDTVAISKELRAVTAELESIAPAEESSVDDLARKRAARRAAAAG